MMKIICFYKYILKIINKDEKILVTYSYWDGSGHRKQVEV